MTAVGLGLVGQFALALAAVAAAMFAPPTLRSRVAGAASTALGVTGAVTGVMVLTGSHGSVAVPTSLAVGRVAFEPTPLGGFFMVVAGAVGAVATVFAIGYATGPSNSRTSWAALAVFLSAMQLVPAAADAISFLLAWETMAVASTILVLTEQAVRRGVRSAALWYASMTHLSFVLVLLGFAVLARSGGGFDWDSLAQSNPHSPTTSAAFVLLTAGFATKAGVVPLHVWLPRAHPAAPSHVSAIMSAAMVKMGVYGMLLFTLVLVPHGPSWWGPALLALGSVAAVYGVIQASVASDLKRLLAYSTTENVGLMFLALGTGLVLRAHGVPGAGDTAVVACLLLVAAHAAFKTTLFLAAGSVVHASGERDLDGMGGLGSRMPVTGLAFGIGALGAAALPVTAGFVAEWALLQAVIHGSRSADPVVAVALPIAMAVVALTTGVALLTFVKAYGIAFLARPRTDGAAAAREARSPMQVAMVVAAASVVILGLVPGTVVRAAASAAGLASGGLDPTRLDLVGVGARLEPAAIVVAVALAAGTILAASAACRRKRRRVELAWGCGGVRASPRMQYTATSYAEPLARIFDDVLQPERDVVVTHAGESRYLVERVQFRQQVEDLTEKRLYRPALRWAERIGIAARGLQNGSIHRYLGYSFLALIAVLLAVTL
jgi:formate hydrogenlyase subunit 3/multisubunit Na+/H+ antiporter MnhD subunit